jgi:hypothetical protein
MNLTGMLEFCIMHSFVLSTQQSDDGVLGYDPAPLLAPGDELCFEELRVRMLQQRIKHDVPEAPVARRGFEVDQHEGSYVFLSPLLHVSHGSLV